MSTVSALSDTSTHSSCLLNFIYLLLSTFQCSHSKQSLLSFLKMGSTLIYICFNKYRQMIIYLLILFASSSISTKVGFMAEGRAISKLIDAAQKSMKEEGLVMVERIQIGSSPPKCERKCRNCVRCETVQVPVPQVQSHRSDSVATAISTTAYTRGDDISNYMPMSWKCKCGDNFYNP